MIKITNTQNNMLKVETPYSAQFVAELKENIGSRKWNASEKAWYVPEESKDVLMKILKDVYGFNGSEDDGKRCTVEITFNESDYVDKDAIKIGGLEIARAFGRDSGARIGEGVIVLEGGFTSGGSRSNWDTRVKEGTKIKIKNFPEWILNDQEAGTNVSGFEIKKISESSIDREKLIKEKEELLARLAEIDKLLEE